MWKPLLISLLASRSQVRIVSWENKTETSSVTFWGDFESFTHIYSTVESNLVTHLLKYCNTVEFDDTFLNLHLILSYTFTILTQWCFCVLLVYALLHFKSHLLQSKNRSHMEKSWQTCCIREEAAVVSAAAGAQGSMSSEVALSLRLTLYKRCSKCIQWLAARHGVWVVWHQSFQ